jgi:hypothetical protein
MESSVKQCTRCGTVKPLGEFYVSTRGAVRCRCRPCDNLARVESNRLRLTANPEEFRGQLNHKQRRWQQHRRTTRPDEHRNKIREAHLRIYYKLTPQQYAAILSQQGGGCAICGQPETAIHPRTRTVHQLSVDHDHGCCRGAKTCGKCVRGLLCRQHNQGLSYFDDDQARLQAAANCLRGQFVAVSDGCRTCAMCAKAVTPKSAPFCGIHNRGVIEFGSDPTLLEAAAAYLRKGAVLQLAA